MTCRGICCTSKALLRIQTRKQKAIPAPILRGQETGDSKEEWAHISTRLSGLRHGSCGQVGHGCGKIHVSAWLSNGQIVTRVVTGSDDDLG